MQYKTEKLINGIIKRIYDDGRIEYYFRGVLHRIGGPAIITKEGEEVWYKNGKLHREDGPAVIYEPPSGVRFQEWRIDGKLHREDGPAIIKSNGYKKWYLYGNEIRKKNFTAEMVARMDAYDLFSPKELFELKQQSKNKPT